MRKRFDHGIMDIEEVINEPLEVPQRELSVQDQRLLRQVILEEERKDKKEEIRKLALRKEELRKLYRDGKLKRPSIFDTIKKEQL